MTADYQNNDISLNDALALLLGHGLWGFRREKVDLVDELERDLADCDLALDESRKSDDEEVTQRCTAAAHEASEEFQRAGKLYTKLCGEIAKIRKDKPSDIVMVDDDPGGKSYDLVLISRQSLIEWADIANIKVGSAHPPPTRKHTTPLLDLMDELIREFWENHDKGNPPKNEQIDAYVRNKYGEWKTEARNGQSECKIPELTENVIKTMRTIMRPVESR